MEPIIRFTGKIVPLAARDVDTDQIIPARFLKTIDKQGLGANLFSDWRYLPSGEPNPDFILNQPPWRGAPILLAGPNFGCGSSREGAVWALNALGIRVVIAPSFGGIFRNNCYQNGTLPLVLPARTIEAFAEIARAIVEDLAPTRRYRRELEIVQGS